mgnify:CR=1 FL=1
MTHYNNVSLFISLYNVYIIVLYKQYIIISSQERRTKGKIGHENFGIIFSFFKLPPKE